MPCSWITENLFRSAGFIQTTCVDFHRRPDLQAAPDLDPDLQALGSPDLWCPSHEVETPFKGRKRREDSLWNLCPGGDEMPWLELALPLEPEEKIAAGKEPSQGSAALTGGFLDLAFQEGSFTWLQRVKALHKMHSIRQMYKRWFLGRCQRQIDDFEVVTQPETWSSAPEFL